MAVRSARRAKGLVFENSAPYLRGNYERHAHFRGARIGRGLTSNGRPEKRRILRAERTTSGKSPAVSQVACAREIICANSLERAISRRLCVARSGGWLFSGVRRPWINGPWIDGAWVDGLGGGEGRGGVGGAAEFGKQADAAKVRGDFLPVTGGNRQQCIVSGE